MQLIVHVHTKGNEVSAGIVDPLQVGDFGVPREPHLHEEHIDFESRLTLQLYWLGECPSAEVRQQIADALLDKLAIDWTAGFKGKEGDDIIF